MSLKNPIHLANTSIFAAGVTLGFLFRRWNTTISNRLKIISISAVFIFFFLFEYTRINGTFQQRVVLIMSVLSVCVIWHIYELARKSYFAVLDEGDGGAQDFIHTEQFVLVDKKKQIRGFYDGTDANEVERIIKDIEVLKREDK